MNYFECSGVDRSVLNYPTIAKANGAIAQFKTDLNRNLLHAICNFNATQAAGTPTPATPLQINGVSAINLYNVANNVIDNDTLINAYIANDGSIVLNTGYKCTDFIELDINATNVVERFKTTQSNERLYRVAFYDNNKTFIDFGFSEMISYADFTRVIPILSGAKYIRACVNVNREIWFIGINAFTTLVNLGGTYYGGTVDAITGKITLTHAIGSLAIGANLWNEDPNRTGVFYGSLPQSYGRKERTDLSACSCFNATNPYATTTADLYISGKPSYGGSVIFFRNSAWAGKTSSEVNALLANETFVYEIATPIVVYTSNTAEIPTIQGDNNAFCDTGNIDIDYILSVDKYIQNQQ